MIVFMRSTIGLTQSERMELSQRATSRSGRADDGRRARLILLLEAGHTWAQIRDKLDCNDGFIDRWNKRFGRERLAGLFSRHAGHGPSKLTPRLEARILDWTLKRKPADGSTHWSMSERQQSDDRAARLLLAVTGQQCFEGALIGAAREELLTIDQIEQGHWLAAQGIDGVPIIHHMTLVSAGRGAPPG